MEEERDDPQKIKRIAASAYDYANDTRWADYRSKVLIPPNMAARSDVVDHHKRKFYRRYIDPDLVVESMSPSSSSQPTQASASSTTMRDSGSTTRVSGTSASSGSNATFVHWDRKTIQFSVNAWDFVVAMLAIFPLVPRNLSNRAYRRLPFMGTACSSLYSMTHFMGDPEHGICKLCKCTCVALIPILCRSVEYVAKFLRFKFSRSTLYRKYLEDACAWVESNLTTISMLSSHAEIGLGFLLTIAMFSWQRNIMQTFMYWQLLKLMYHTPVTASYHQSVWAKIGKTVNPLVHHYAPFLNIPISAIQRWRFR